MFAWGKLRFVSGVFPVFSARPLVSRVPILLEPLVWAPVPPAVAMTLLAAPCWLLFGTWRQATLAFQSLIPIPRKRSLEFRLLPPLVCRPHSFQLSRSFIGSTRHWFTTAPQPPIIIIIVSFSLGQSLAVPLLGIIKSNQPQNKASKKKKEKRSTRLWALFLSFLKSTCRNTE